MNRHALGTVATMVRLNLLRIRRDRVFLFSIFVLPVLVVIIVGVAGGSSRGLPVAVVVEERTPAAESLVAALRTQDGLRVRELDSREVLTRSVRRDEVLAGLVIIDGYAAALEAGESVGLPFHANPTRPRVAAARTLVSAVISREAAVAQAATFASSESGVPVADAAAAARRVADISTVDVVATVEGERLVPTLGFGFAGPANLLLFMFVTSITAAGHVVESRKLGVTARASVSPTSPRVLVAGEACSRFAVTLLQGVFIVGVTAVAFDVPWGDPVATAAVIGAFALVCTGAAMVVGVLARTFEQSVTFGPPIGVALAMAGGCVWPVELVDERLARFGWLTPHRWALDALVDTTERSASLGNVLLPIAVLVCGAVVLLVPAVHWFRRSIAVV